MVVDRHTVNSCNARVLDMGDSLKDAVMFWLVMLPVGPTPVGATVARPTPVGARVGTGEAGEVGPDGFAGSTVVGDSVGVVGIAVGGGSVGSGVGVSVGSGVGGSVGSGTGGSVVTGALQSALQEP